MGAPESFETEVGDKVREAVERSTSTDALKHDSET